MFKDTRVLHIFIWLLAMTVEDEGEETGSQQLVLLMVLKKIPFPGQELEILGYEATGKGQGLPQWQGRMCLAEDFPMASKGIESLW